MRPVLLVQSINGEETQSIAHPPNQTPTRTHEERERSCRRPTTTTRTSGLSSISSGDDYGGDERREDEGASRTETAKWRGLARPRPRPRMGRTSGRATEVRHRRGHSNVFWVIDLSNRTHTSQASSVRLIFFSIYLVCLLRFNV